MFSGAMDSAGLSDLPLELVEKILETESLLCEDLAAVSQTCHILQKKVDGSNRLWMRKMLLRWPELRDVATSNINWRDEYYNLRRVFKFCRQEIMKMSSLYYWAKISLSDCHLGEFLKMSEDFNGRGYHYLKLFLGDLCTKVIDIKDSTPHTGLYNMTNQYYGEIVLDFLSKHHLKKEWSDGSGESWIPERVASFLDQWMEPKYYRFDSEFDRRITALTEDFIAQFPREHPVHKISSEERQKWRYQLLSDNQYDSKSCQLLIREACLYLAGNGLISDDDPTPRTLIFRSVLSQRKNNKYYSTIILEALLRRCGVRCDIVFFHHFLKWREDWKKESPMFLVNPFTGVLSSNRRCPYSNMDFNESNESLSYHYSPLNLLLSCADGIKNASEPNKRSFRRSVELLTFLEPDNEDNFLPLLEAYLDLKKDTRIMEQQLTALKFQTLRIHQREQIEIVLRKIDEKNIRLKEPSRKIIRRRVPLLRLAVGMVCYHKVNGYLCVIKGWDTLCTTSEKWKMSMRSGITDNTETQQPYYNVLAMDFSDRYVAEENLVCVNPSQRLTYIEEKLALEFSHFDGYFYIPNAEKDEEYPEDHAIREKYRSNWK